MDLFSESLSQFFCCVLICINKSVSFASYMIYEFRHAGLVVKDLEKQVGFYTKVLGFIIKKSADEDATFIGNVWRRRQTPLKTVKMSAEKGGGGSLLELLYFPRNNSLKHKKSNYNTLGYTHIALSVKDVSKVYLKFKKLGLFIFSKPQKSPDGYAKIFFGRDPEGNILELVEVLDKK